MATKTPKDVFVWLLSQARQNTERTASVFQEINEAVDNDDIREALEARIFVSDKILSQIDRCFALLDESPVKITSRVQEVFAEDFRKELDELQNPLARHIFILAKAAHLAHLRIAEFQVLTTAADLAGHFGVGVLLEVCLADQLAFVERTRRLVGILVQRKVSEKLAA